jgi:nucleoside-diphosphate-sugar epimerase
MDDSLRIAVLGAGYVGSAFAAAAAAAGHRVIAVRRSAQPGGDGVQWLRGDVTSGEVAGMPPQLDAVVLTVAPGGSDYNATYPPAAAAAVALAARTGATRVVYTSSTGVYGERAGAWVTEASPRLGTSDGNAALSAAEDIVLACRTAEPTVLRVAGIYGPGRDPRARMRNAAALPQSGEYWMNLAHRDDIVSAILHMITTATPPPLCNVSDGSPTLACDVARWLASDIGADPAALTFNNAEQRSRNNQRVANTLLVSRGWAPRYPSFREGFAHGLE